MPLCSNSYGGTRRRRCCSSSVALRLCRPPYINSPAIAILLVVVAAWPSCRCLLMLAKPQQAVQTNHVRPVCFSLLYRPHSSLLQSCLSRWRLVHSTLLTRTLLDQPISLLSTSLFSSFSQFFILQLHHTTSMHFIVLFTPKSVEIQSLVFQSLFSMVLTATYLVTK